MISPQNRPDPGRPIFGEIVTNFVVKTEVFIGKCGKLSNMKSASGRKVAAGNTGGCMPGKSWRGRAPGPC